MSHYFDLRAVAHALGRCYESDGHDCSPAADAFLDGPTKEVRGCFLRVAALAILAVEQIDTERSSDRVKRKRRRS